MVQKNTQIAFASSYRMNHAGMRKGQEQQMLTALKFTSEMQVCGRWYLPSSGQQFAVLIGPGTRKEVLLPITKAECHCVN